MRDSRLHLCTIISKISEENFMHEECYVLAHEDFFRKLDDSLIINENALLSMIFFTRESRRNEKFSKDEEEKLILEGWQHFLEEFPLPCYYYRSDWVSYLVLLKNDTEQIFPAFKQVFKVWEQELYPHLWRIAFTNLKDSKNRELRMIGDFYDITDDAIRYYYPSEKFFRIDPDERYAIPISLS
jgi:hypothetical protein